MVRNYIGRIQICLLSDPDQNFGVLCKKKQVQFRNIVSGLRQTGWISNDRSGSRGIYCVFRSFLSHPLIYFFLLLSPLFFLLSCHSPPAHQRPKFLQQPMSNCYNGYMVNTNNNTIGFYKYIPLSDQTKILGSLLPGNKRSGPHFQFRSSRLDRGRSHWAVRKGEL